MKSRRTILREINKYSGITFGALFLVQTILGLFDHDHLFTPSYFRLLSMATSFFILFFFSSGMDLRISSALTIMIFVVGMILYPAYAPGIDTSDIIIIFISLIATSIIPISIYNPIRSAKIIWFWNLVIVAAAAVGIFASILKLDATGQSSDFLTLLKDEPMIPFALLGSFMAINWIVFQYQRSNFQMQQQIEETNAALESKIGQYNQKNQVLTAQHDQLQQLQVELEKANLDMEQHVQRNTQSVNDKLKLLLKYSYVNSHFLRSPVTRIQSTIEAWDYLQHNERIEIISNSTEEIASIIEAINEISIQNMDAETTEEYIQSFYERDIVNKL